MVREFLDISVRRKWQRNKNHKEVLTATSQHEANIPASAKELAVMLFKENYTNTHLVQKICIQHSASRERTWLPEKWRNWKYTERNYKDRTEKVEGYK